MKGSFTTRKGTLCCIVMTCLCSLLATGCASKYGAQMTDVHYYPDCYQPIADLRSAEKSFNTTMVMGTTMGALLGAVIGTLIIAAAPYVARMVESSLKEVPAGVIEAAQAMGCTNLQIIWHVLLPEAKPSLISGSIISTVTILSYTALAATLGGTGLGQVAIIYGHQRSQKLVVWVCVFLIVIIVQVIQIVGTRILRRTDKRAR